MLTAIYMRTLLNELGKIQVFSRGVLLYRQLRFLMRYGT